MPVTIYPTNLKYKNSNGQFQSATAIKGDSGAGIVEQVSGTDPIIVCEDNHKYICGEVSSLNITPSANGVSEIIFTSGSSAAVLTVPNTIKWPEWFSPNTLETNATYQLKITNNLANVAMWPEEGLTGDTRVRIQKMLGIYEPPFELVNDITLTEEAHIVLTADKNGKPYNFIGLYIVVTYPANTPSATTGYGRYWFTGESGSYPYVGCETSKYVTNSAMCFKLIKVKKEANITYCWYTRPTTTGSYGAWSTKNHENGSAFGLGNITQISMPDNDVEPAGTRIRIFAQWAY